MCVMVLEVVIGKVYFIFVYVLLVIIQLYDFFNYKGVWKMVFIVCLGEGNGFGEELGSFCYSI